MRGVYYETKCIQFIQPYLTHLEFSLTDKFSPQKDKVLLNTSISIIKCNKKSEEHKIDVVLGVEIGGDEPSNPFHIRAAMQGTFKWDETVDNENIREIIITKRTKVSCYHT